MTAQITPDDVRVFSGLVTEGLGLRVSDLPASVLSDALARRAASRHWPPGRYLDWLPQNLRGPELGHLATELTVSETYFFRDTAQLRAFTDAALAQRLQATPDGEQLRILSAGCSTGEEPYTLAMLVRDTAPTRADAVSICALDVNPQAIEHARRARYSAWALRQTPPGVRDRWFRPDDGAYLLDDDIRAAVTFAERNLIEGDLSCGGVSRYDIVFCRNALMYLTAPNFAKVIEQVRNALLPGGFLFLGHAETLRGMTEAFTLQHTHGAFYYQRPMDDLGGTVTGTAARPAQQAWPDPAWAVQPVLTQVVRAVPAARPRPSVARPPVQPDLSTPLALFVAERFADALEAVRTLPLEARDSADARVLTAVVLAAAGDFHAAEELCRSLLSTNRRDARAHYVLAACRDAVGDHSGATEHNRTAAHLDPSFAMPRLHLGLLARRAGDTGAARGEFAQALTLISREHADRLQLFGGGFTRAALVNLCRAELRSVGGAP